MSRNYARVGIYSGFAGLLLGAMLGVSITHWRITGGLPRWYSHPGEYGERLAHGAILLAQFDLSELLVDSDDLIPGGPPKDGIPSLTNPPTMPAADVEFLDADDRIISVTLGGQSRAYPLRLLNWHEAVNDELGGVPIAVVYCPLCDSVTVMDRRIDGETLTFGISGLLFQSNVLLFDREHDGLWSQVLLQAISGRYAGRSLEHYGWELTTFDEWRQRFSDGDVVTFETGVHRDYVRNPYEHYFASDDLRFSVKREDDRLDRKARIVGIALGDTYRAYPVEAVFRAPRGTLIDEVNGQRVAISGDIETGRVVVNEKPREALVIHTFWFTWAAAHPQTGIYDGRE